MPTNRAANRFPVFAERFRELRGEKTQDEFALLLDISRPTVYYYENGERLPDALVIQRICERCNVSADWLLGISDVKTVDVETAAISKLIGLDEAAIKKLHFISHSDELDSWQLLSSEDFVHLLNKLILHENFIGILRGMRGAIKENLRLQKRKAPSRSSDIFDTSSALFATIQRLTVVIDDLSNDTEYVDFLYNADSWERESKISGEVF